MPQTPRPPATPQTSADDATLSCEECLSEIPASVAHSLEGPDYVHHFCGLECYERWQQTHSTASAAGDQQTPGQAPEQMSGNKPGKK